MKKERIRRKDLFFERVRHSGMLVISALIGDCLVHRGYMYYTKREAARLFLQEANGIKKGRNDMTRHEKMMADIERHGRQLLDIYPNAVERDPVRLCKKLFKIERKARQYTTDYCNGVIQPDDDYANIKAYDDKFLSAASAVLGEGGPALMINHDPRGCAIKIDSDDMAGVELYRDMGGYGIIAPKFDGE